MKIDGIENIDHINTTFGDLLYGDVFFPLIKDTDDEGYVLPKQEELQIYVCGYIDSGDSHRRYGIRLTDGCITWFGHNSPVQKLRYKMEIKGIL